MLFLRVVPAELGEIDINSMIFIDFKFFENLIILSNPALGQF